MGNPSKIACQEVVLSKDLIHFGLTWFVDAGDDAPSQKEISQVLVRLLLRKDVKTIFTTPSTRMLRTTSTH